jgi:hypothetical protein
MIIRLTVDGDERKSFIRAAFASFINEKIIPAV